MTNEEWHDCNWVGTIKVYDNEPKQKDDVVENLDDYDMRKELGSRVRNVRSKFVMEEM